MDSVIWYVPRLSIGLALTEMSLIEKSGLTSSLHSSMN